MSQSGPWILRVMKPQRIYLEDGRFPLGDLAFLARHSRTVRHLSVQGDGVVDVDSIHGLGKLDSLTIRAGRLSGPLELARFPGLTWLTLDIDDGATIVWEGAGPLEWVDLTGGDERAAEAVADLPHLEGLTLTESHVPARFVGPIAELEIESPAALPAGPIAGLGMLANLMLTNVRVEDLTLFEGAGKLEQLWVLDSPYITSLAGVRLAEIPDAELWLEGCRLLSDLGEVVPPAGATTIEDCPRLAWEPSA